jgi:chemotaxis signal transduction protein
VNALFGRADRSVSSPPEYAAVVSAGDRRIALGIDQAVGLLQVPIEKVQEARQPAPESEEEGGNAAAGHLVPASVLRGLFFSEDVVVNIIDAERLLASSGLPVLKKPPLRQQRALKAGTHEGEGKDAGDAIANKTQDPDAGCSYPVLSFVAGGATFGLKAVDIHATVPRCTIDLNALSAGICMGSILYHGQRIPVLRTPELAGVGAWGGQMEAEIVIVRAGDRKRIGLAVDAIERMLICNPENVHVPPPVVSGKAGIISGVISTSQGCGSIFLVDALRLRSLAIVSELADLSIKGTGAESRKEADANAFGTDVVPLNKRFLIFRAGGAVAVPVEQVMKITTPPSALVPSAPDGALGVKGVFWIDGAPVLYVDLVEVLGLDAGDEERSRLLLVGQGPHRLAFAVNSVDGIETSEWRKPGDADRGSIVQLGKGPSRRVLPEIDFRAVASPYFQVS